MIETKKHRFIYLDIELDMIYDPKNDKYINE